MIDSQKRFPVFQALAVFVLLILPFLCCSDASAPLAPEEGDIQQQLEFFPLRENYSVYYKFSYKHDYFYGESASLKLKLRHNSEGSFHLEVIRVLELDEVTYYRIRSTFLVDKEEYHQYFAKEDSISSKENFSVGTDYDVIFKDGSLWHVENAPDFERLGEGELSLMMEAPVAAGGEVDLMLFNYPRRFDLGKYEGGVQGDSSFYHSVEEPQDWKKIKFARNKGLVEIDYFTINGASTYKDITTIKFKLNGH